MDLATHSESGKLEQVVSQFLLKSLHIILDSRIPSLHAREQVDSISRVRKSDKWFNLVLGDRPAALENLNFWHKNLMDPMIIDILLVQQGTTTTSSVDNLLSASPGRASATETVIERWVVQFESPVGTASRPGDGSASYKKTYKKSIIFLRSLYLQMKLLPAYRIFRQLSSSTQPYNFDIIYKVSSFSEPFSRAEEEVMKEYCFVPIEALPGRLHVSVTYRAQLSDFDLQPLTTMPPKIIPDYVGSPAIDPLRHFPSSYKGDRSSSFLYKGVHSPTSVPFQRPHSWTSGFYKPPANTVNQPFAGSPPVYRRSPMSYDSPSPPIDRIQSLRRPLHQRAPFHDECQLSPPFSPSVSPSTPTYLRNIDSPRNIRASSESAPVTIPFPLTARSSRYISPNFSDPSKLSLPPLSPRSTRPDHSSNSSESPSGIRLMKKSEASKPGDLSYAGHKVLKDNRDDSGRFSGVLSSRSSSKLSFQDDIDDCDFSCPFDVDDVDTPDSQISQNLDGKRNLESTSLGRKSQDAAVGVLVHMLRTAPPLRQDSSCYSTHSLRAEVEDGVPAVATASGFFMARRTADALEELRSYREMRDLLLSKSGTCLLTREPT